MPKDPEDDLFSSKLTQAIDGLIRQITALRKKGQALTMTEKLQIQILSRELENLVKELGNLEEDKK